MQLGHRLVEREQDEFTIDKVYRNVEPFMCTKKKDEAYGFNYKSSR